MADFLQEPITFSAAARWLRSRATLPTTLGSADIANQIPANIRMQAFTSARVSEASVLEEFRAEVDKMLAGDTSLAYARERLMAKLERAGYEVPGAGSPGDANIQSLGSTSRINLILRQNVRMAQAIGSREVSEHPDVRSAFPNYRYHANTDRHAKFDGLVLPKNDPFWQTHFPPWEFNCNCMVTDEAGPANARSAGPYETKQDGSQTGELVRGDQKIPVESSGSGFVFASDPRHLWDAPNFDGIADDALRADVQRAVTAKRDELGL